MLEEEMFEKKIWAVVGANQDREKYGNMVYRKIAIPEWEKMLPVLK